MKNSEVYLLMSPKVLIATAHSETGRVFFVPKYKSPNEAIETQPRGCQKNSTQRMPEKLNPEDARNTTQRLPEKLNPKDARNSTQRLTKKLNPKDARNSTQRLPEKINP